MAFKQNMNLSPRQQAEQKFKSAKLDLLIIIICTAVNMIFLLTGSGTYFLFSASIPYYLTFFGLFLTGRMPDEFYVDSGITSADFLPPSVLYVFVALAIICLALYLFCFIMLKKPKKVWFIVALVFFCIDTVAMFFLSNIAESIRDLIFHALVIVVLVLGIKACSDLEVMPEQTAAAPMGSFFANQPQQQPADPFATTQPTLEQPTLEQPAAEQPTVEQPTSEQPAEEVVIPEEEIVEEKPEENGENN